MKKATALLLIVLFSMPAFAAPVTTDLVGKNRVAVGVETDFVIDRDLKVTLKGYDFAGIGSAKVQQYRATLGYGVTENVTVTAKAGSASLKFDELDFGQNPSVGLDVLAKLWEWHGWELLANGSASGLIGLTATDPDFKYDADWMEYQVAGMVAKDFMLWGYPVRPYGGLVYSHLDADTEMEVNTDTFVFNERLTVNTTNRHKLGFVAGASAQVWKDMSVKVQGRFGRDEKAVTASGVWRI